MIKKICFTVLSRANYGSIRKLMSEVMIDKKLTMQLVVGASALTDEQGKCVDLINKDGFKINYRADMNIKADQPSNMAQTVGIGLLKLPEIYSKLKPDVIFVVGDRYEIMSAVISASYMNIPIAHTMGGEITGTIDESVRHAVSKFSHLHFVSNKDSYDRIVKLGEKKHYVFNVGCPRIDLVKDIIKQKLKKKSEIYVNKHGVGDNIDFENKFIIVSQHPVTTEYSETISHIKETLKAIEKINIQAIFLWPNTDAGSEQISKQIRIWRERKKMKKIRFLRNIPSDYYITLMKNASCIVGNSSSAIREGSYIGIPAINIGTRQNKRLRGKNVIDVRNNSAQIINAIKKQIKVGKYKSQNIYGNGTASKKIVKILKRIKNINIQKTNSY
tara:strand:- start:14262 stop:15422 length:1161 start_codon:yes stop_codon:yes gene_type:complete